MTIYQKAIKVRLVCENTPICKGNNKCPYFDKHKGNNKCSYFDKCKVSELEKSPCFERIGILADIIIKEKWNVK